MNTKNTIHLTLISMKLFNNYLIISWNYFINFLRTWCLVRRKNTQKNLYSKLWNLFRRNWFVPNIAHHATRKYLISMKKFGMYIKLYNNDINDQNHHFALLLRGFSVLVLFSAYFYSSAEIFYFVFPCCLVDFPALQRGYAMSSFVSIRRTLCFPAFLANNHGHKILYRFQIFS